MNEEDIKARVIIPWLQARGVRPDELSFEVSFKLRIGHTDVVIGGRPDKSVQRARLDILVKRRGVNLLVVEAKASSEGLTKDDRDQAVSYARLLDTIAPFALVTNGDAWELYDVLSKELVTADSFQFPDDTTIVLPNESRLEALRLFFDLSPHNIALFARAQMDGAIQPLVGPPSDYTAVYISETHVERSNVTDAATAFMKGSKPLFVLVGESGMGKSCVMIDLARELSDAKYPVLFFRGALLDGDILDQIADEVGWAFGPDRSSIETLRRLSATSGGRALVVMVDGIEDWAHPSKVQHLVGLASRLAPLNVRLVVSCKTASWQLFTAAFGTSTGIERAIHNGASHPYSAQVGPFVPREFSKAVEKHREAYGMGDGGFDPAAMKEAQSSPFMMRLMFQVKASERGSRASVQEGERDRIAFDSASFFETYLRLAARRTGQEEVTINVLISTAKAMYERNEEWLEEQVLRREVGLRITEQLPPSIFDQRLLVGVGVLGLRRIGFGFGQLRNYIIAFHVMRWSGMTHGTFATHFAETTWTGLRAEALSFYYPFAPEATRATIDAPARQHALDYLEKYVGLIDGFPSIRDYFEPGTKGRIGFLGELQLPARVGMFGFRPIDSNQEPVSFVPVDGSDGHAVRLFVEGVREAHYFGSVRGFRSTVTTAEILRGEIVPQIEGMVKRGALNEAAAPELTRELVECMLKEHRFFREFVDQASTEVRYPIDLKAMQLALKTEFLYRHFRDETVRQKRRQGGIKETWRGTMVSYSANLTLAEELNVAERVQVALASPDDVAMGAYYTDLERLRLRLTRAIEALGPLGAQLDAPLFPLLTTLAKARRGEDRPFAAVKEHCRQVLEVAQRAYRAVIESNFPGWEERFQLYHRGPVKMILALDDKFAFGEGRSFLATCESTSGSDEVVVCDLSEATLDIFADTVRTAHGEESYLTARRPNIGEFLYGRYNGMDYDGEGALLRRIVYGWIQDDFRLVSHAFR